MKEIDNWKATPRDNAVLKIQFKMVNRRIRPQHAASQRSDYFLLYNCCKSFAENFGIFVRNKGHANLLT